MNDIDFVSLIKKENLDNMNYLKTLLAEAYNVGIINDEEMKNIQIQLLELLDKRVYQYNGLESSSIRKEILEQISNSNVYTIEIYLKSFENPDKAIKELKEKGIEHVYLKGRGKINKMLDIIRVYYMKTKQNLLKVNNITYNDTIIGGIKGFLKIYDPDYNAQDMKITADYPIYNNLIGKFEGVEFIEKYIKSIYIENKFCNMFSEKRIIYLLKSYPGNSDELILNIFEVVLLEVIACVLAGRNVQDLIISETELGEIYSRLISKEKDGITIEEQIDDVYEKLSKELLKDEEEIQKYIKRNFCSTKKLIAVSIKHNNLDKIFITEKYIEQ